MAVKASKMAVVFGGCGRECLSGPGNTGLDGTKTTEKTLEGLAMDTEKEGGKNEDL